MAHHSRTRGRLLLTTLLAALELLWLGSAQAIPVFARKYDMSCATCHAAVPRLNSFGEQFAANNLKLDNWREKTISAGDDMLALPAQVPLALRAQAYLQAREGESIDPITGEGEKASTDFQAPYLVKLLSSAPLTKHISYYFYAIFAEKGSNGEVVVEDAWFQHDDLFGSRVGMQFGQFQLSDLMFPREIRLTFQDYMIYRMAGITYDRGVLFDRGFGPVDIGLGFVNGNGIEQNFNINSPGFRRPDKLFDNDSDKTLFGRIGTEVGGVSAGLFGLAGKQKSAAGDAGLDTGDRNTDKRIVGLDLSGNLRGNIYWYGQFLWNSWDGFLDQDPTIDYQWWGLFGGVDYVHSDRWTFSALYNYADAGDLDNTDTIYEGIDINTLSVAASYYFMRNVKGVAEVNIDFQPKDAQSGNFFTGHLTKEHYFLLGFDAAF